MALEAYTSPAAASVSLDAARAEAKASRESAGAADVSNILLGRKNRELEGQLLEAKKALHGQVAVRNALKSALAEVAPEHELNNGKARERIRDEAEAKVTADSPWWPNA